MEPLSGTLLFDLQIFAQEKTEEPTPRKRRKEREEGRIAQSKDLSAAITILSGIGSLFFLSGFMWHSYVAFLQWCTAWLPSIAMDQAEWSSVLARKSTFLFLRMWLPMAAIVMGLSFFVTASQAGLKISSKPLIPKMDRFDPAKGLKKMFSLKSLVEALKAILKAGFLFVILYFGIKNEITLFYRVSQTDPASGLSLVLHVFLRLSLKLGLALLCLGILDFGFQKWEFSRSIKMTKQEVKDEFKQTEGDPMVRQRIRGKQSELSRSRMMSQVPEADVVVTNPTHFAIALKYDRDQMNAPTVTAKGAGYIAMKIKEVARESGVPMVEDKKIARTLYRNSDIGQEIPEDLYIAVAEVLAYVYSLRNKDEKDRP